MASHSPDTEVYAIGWPPDHWFGGFSMSVQNEQSVTTLVRFQDPEHRFVQVPSKISGVKLLVRRIGVITKPSTPRSAGPRPANLR